MHPKNRHQSRYDLAELSKGTPELKAFVAINKYGDESIDFSNSEAVKILNRAILKNTYGIEYWDIPDNFLCPPIPGRADYIHTIAELFPDPMKLKVLDIGVGANCIYPLLGLKEYDWKMVGSEVNPDALKNAQNILNKNQLTSSIELRLQSNSGHIFKNIIQPHEQFDLTLCNPPFHESQEAALAGSSRKWKNLGKKPTKSLLNFGGKSQELWCPGGEKAFIQRMIEESLIFQKNCQWFSTLVSKEANLPYLKSFLKGLSSSVQIKILEMEQGQKKSRILAWKFI